MNIPTIPFVEFPKISRLNRDIIVTEKLDGTNAQIYIPGENFCECGHSVLSHDTNYSCAYCSKEGRKCNYFTEAPNQPIYAGSRTRWITPEQDNHGFARWVQENRDELMHLGPGNHFGEWWGSGIQRGYGLKEKRFSLFNVSRWGPGGKEESFKPACCHVVPVLWRGNFETFMEDGLDSVMSQLSFKGSEAAPGFMKPEGIVVFHTAGGQLFKKTLEKDDQPKGANR
jgi:hypothetical protein